MKEFFEFFNNPIFSMGFATGSIVGCLILEPLIINFIYFSNIALFRDIILTNKNRIKLDNYYGGKNDI